MTLEEICTAEELERLDTLHKEWEELCEAKEANERQFFAWGATPANMNDRGRINRDMEANAKKTSEIIMRAYTRNKEGEKA